MRCVRVCAVAWRFPLTGLKLVLYASALQVTDALIRKQTTHGFGDYVAQVRPPVLAAELQCSGGPRTPAGAITTRESRGARRVPRTARAHARCTAPHAVYSRAASPLTATHADRSDPLLLCAARERTSPLIAAPAGCHGRPQARAAAREQQHASVLPRSTRAAPPQQRRKP